MGLPFSTQCVIRARCLQIKSINGAKLWTPDGTAEQDCCHCQQDAALCSGHFGLGEGAVRQGPGISVPSQLSNVFVQGEE